ncbi:MAG: hypothetical protein JNL07_05600 [Rhodospirillales bacterium]|nr:hypothetical protein [Rhodospirillales bacterium]
MPGMFRPDIRFADKPTAPQQLGVTLYRAGRVAALVLFGVVVATVVAVNSLGPATLPFDRGTADLIVIAAAPIAAFCWIAGRIALFALTER